jgi:RNA polymerase sigma-70 factor, ECF subfamily
MGDVTRLLARARLGDSAASAQLIEEVYRELRSIAGRCLRAERPGHTLQATALVHEAYLRLAGQHGMEWESRAHFFSVAARMMRRVLLDYARKHHAVKRGGGGLRQTLDEGMLISEDKLANVLAMDEALERLAVLDPRQAQIVELRFFGGLQVEEIATVLQVSEPTVKREWRSARAWLAHEMGGTNDGGALAGN